MSQNCSYPTCDIQPDTSSTLCFLHSQQEKNPIKFSIYFKENIKSGNIDGELHDAYLPHDFRIRELEEEISITFVNSTFRGTVTISGAHIESISFRGCTFVDPHKYHTQETILSKGLSINKSKIEGSISFSNCKSFEPIILGEDLNIGNSINISRCRFSDYFDVKDSNINTFRINNSCFTTALNLSDLNIENASYFLGGVFRKVNISNSNLRESLTIDNSTFHGKLDISRETTIQKVFLQNDTHLKSGINIETSSVTKKTLIYNSEIFGESKIKNSNFESGFYVKSSHLDNVYFDSCDFFEEVIFRDAFNGSKKVRLKNITFIAGFSITSTKNERAFEGGEAYFSDLQFGSDAAVSIQNADLRKARFRHTDVRNIQFVGVEWTQQKWNEWIWRCFAPDRDAVYDEKEESNKDEPNWSEIERIYRQLKQNFEERSNFYQAGHFHIGEKEMQLRRAEACSGRKAMLKAYRYISIYGERASPAAITTLLFILLFTVAYSLTGLNTAPQSTTYNSMVYASSSVLCADSCSQALKTCWKSFVYALQVTAFSKPQGYEAATDLGYLIKILQRGITTPLIALFALAIRQQMKR
ncbi:hypothetical protein [Salinibacter sp.]|uniref:hypothetical protein n=1 Tax=Salinibacter sp. TaxID=2065818 RepID=UPI0021E95C08|nr:hypothetical protein [Salinibacter sp.]